MESQKWKPHRNLPLPWWQNEDWLAVIAGGLSDLSTALVSTDAGAIRAATKRVEAAVEKMNKPATAKPMQKFITPLLSKRTGTLATVLRAGNFQRVVWLGLIYFGIAAVVVKLMGGHVAGFSVGFAVVFALACCAQVFNVIWTLTLAWLLFGGLLFAVPNIK